MAARLAGDESGAALIEFAISLPVLLLIMVGIVDLGFAFQKFQVVTNAAREGARMAVLRGYDEADVQARVAEYLAAAGVTDTAVSSLTLEVFTPAAAAPFPVGRVVVEVPHTFSYLAPFAAIFGGDFDSVTLRAASVMRVEVAAAPAP